MEAGLRALETSYGELEYKMEVLNEEKDEYEESERVRLQGLAEADYKEADEAYKAKKTAMDYLEERAGKIATATQELDTDGCPEYDPSKQVSEQTDQTKKCKDNYTLLETNMGELKVKSEEKVGDVDGLYGQIFNKFQGLKKEKEAAEKQAVEEEKERKKQVREDIKRLTKELKDMRKDYTEKKKGVQKLLLTAGGDTKKQAMVEDAQNEMFDYEEEIRDKAAQLRSLETEVENEAAKEALAQLIADEAVNVGKAADAYKTLRKSWDDQVGKAATAKKALDDGAAAYAANNAKDSPDAGIKSTWEGNGDGSKTKLEGAFDTEDGKIADLWTAYKKWLDEDYETWAETETEEFEKRWTKADTDFKISSAVETTAAAVKSA